MVVILSSIAILASSLMYFRLYHGFILYLMVRPIIDWGYDVKFSGVSILAIGSLIPISLVLIKPYMWNKPWRFGGYPFVNSLYMGFMGYVIFHLIAIDATNGDAFVALDAFVRLICGIVGAILFLVVINSEKRYQRLLKAMLVMGMIPATILILQHFELLEEARSRMYGENVRLSAYHHGTVSLRHYFSYAILASVALMYMEPAKVKWIKYPLVILIALIGMSLLYSKSGVLFLATVPILAIITLYNRSKWFSIFILLIPMAFSFNSMSQYSGSVFYKEIASYNIITEESGERIGALNGRLLAWERLLNNVQSASTFDFMLGKVDHIRIGFRGGVHNDFLMNLGRYGLIGLVLYSCLLLTVVIFAFFICKASSFDSALSKSRLFVFRGLVTIWVIDSVGMHVSMIPMFLLMTFGFMAIVNRDLFLKRLAMKKRFYVN